MNNWFQRAACWSAVLLAWSALSSEVTAQGVDVGKYPWSADAAAAVGEFLALEKHTPIKAERPVSTGGAAVGATEVLPATAMAFGGNSRHSFDAEARRITRERRLRIPADLSQERVFSASSPHGRARLSIRVTSPDTYSVEFRGVHGQIRQWNLDLRTDESRLQSRLQLESIREEYNNYHQRIPTLWKQSIPSAHRAIQGLKWAEMWDQGTNLSIAAWSITPLSTATGTGAALSLRKSYVDAAWKKSMGLVGPGDTFAKWSSNASTVTGAVASLRNTMPMYQIAWVKAAGGPMAVVSGGFAMADTRSVYKRLTGPHFEAIDNVPTHLEIAQTHSLPLGQGLYALGDLPRSLGIDLGRQQQFNSPPMLGYKLPPIQKLSPPLMPNLYSLPTLKVNLPSITRLNLPPTLSSYRPPMQRLNTQPLRTMNLPSMQRTNLQPMRNSMSPSWP